MQEKPEDFSWDEEILELRNQIFGYLLAIFRQTELATTLWKLSVKHEETNNLYMDFVRKQKKGWVPFGDVMKVYARHTDCSLVEGGLSNTDADDLTHYIAAIVSAFSGIPYSPYTHSMVGLNSLPRWF